jgi:hypothetical protein
MERAKGFEPLTYGLGNNRTQLSGVERPQRKVAVGNIARIAFGLSVERWMLWTDE